MSRLRSAVLFAAAAYALVAGTARAQDGGPSTSAPAPRAEPPRPAPAADPARVDTTTVYELRQLTTEPELANRREVAEAMSRVYPRALREEGIAGRVTMAAVIGRDGRVEATRVVSATRPDFGDAADQVVQMMRFRPGKIGGVPVRARIELPVTFDIH